MTIQYIAAIQILPITGAVIAVFVLSAFALLYHRKGGLSALGTGIIALLLFTSIIGTLSVFVLPLLPEPLARTGTNAAPYALLVLETVLMITLIRRLFQNSHPSPDTESNQTELSPGLPKRSNGDEGTWHWDIVGDKIQFSAELRNLLGYTPTEFPDTFESWERRLHPEDQQNAVSALEEQLDGTHDYDVTYRLQGADKSYRWYRSRASLTRSKEGRPLFLSGTIRDVHDQVSDRLRLAANEELFRAVFERANVGLALTDGEGNFCEVNPALCRMLRYDAADLLTKSFRSITHPEDLQRSADHHTQLADEDTTHLELEKRYVRKDGEVIHAITGLSRLQENRSTQGPQTLVHIQDVTTLKRAEQQAIESSQFKSQFLAHMSHEIRTPLGGLLGMIELALGTELTDEQQHFLITAKRSSEQLMLLINDILDLSKIEAGKIEIVPNEFDLREVTSTLVTTYSLRAHEKGLELAYHIDDAIPNRLVADWSRIHQVISNLLSNAIKFTKSGQVVLEIRLDRRGKQGSKKETQPLTFCVSDTGIGIAPDKCQEIFEAFRHADNTIPQKYGGSGLGLAISQELVSLMGGHISVESEVDSGSRFTFTLPIQLPGDVTSQALMPERNYGNLRALVIDDNETSLEFLSRLLAAAGIEPTGFTSTLAAESYLTGTPHANDPFDLCLIDSRIPGNEGFKFPKQIESHLKGPESVVLLLSSPNRELELERCRQLGFDFHLSKPVVKQQLYQTLDRMLKKGGLEEDKTTNPSKRILVVEDNPINSEVALNFLKQFGHHVLCVENGKEALNALDQSSFDILLMDLQMPEMTGLEATKIIREQEEGTQKHQWIIALTAQSMKGDREECLAAGMDDYVSKPIKRHELQAALERVPELRATQSKPSPPANSDPSSLIQAFEGEINVAKKVAQIFLETTPTLWSSLTNAVENRDANAIRSSAHRLKGSYMQFGAERAEQLAYQLETAGREGQVEGLEDTIHELDEATRELKQQIYQLLRH